MGSKLEYLLILLILIVLSIFFIFDNSFENKKTNQFLTQKESEINNFILYEINASNLLYKLKAKKAFKIKKNWYLTKPIIKNSKIKYLISKQAIYYKDKILFIKDVNLLKEDNTTYSSQKAIYFTKKKELLTPKNFIITKNRIKIRGKKLIYQFEKNITKAKDVEAIIKLKDSKK